MDARQLEYFLAVADHGSFNRAAASLYLAQPSLSQAIRNLERELNVLLFHRIGRRIELTEAGRAMIEPARQVLRDLDTVKATAESVQGLRTGRLEIASMPSPAVQPLTTMIGAYLRSYPAMRVEVRAAATAPAVIEAVRTGAVEIGLAGTAAELLAADVKVHPVARQRFVVLAPPDAGLRLGCGVRMEELAGSTAIVAPPGTRQGAGGRGQGARRAAADRGGGGSPRGRAAAGPPGGWRRRGDRGVDGPSPRRGRARAGSRAAAVPAHLAALPARPAHPGSPGVPGLRAALTASDRCCL
jgi:DNA-binding transcriptional LysR family regulator